MTERRRPAIWSPEAISDLETIWDYYARAAGLAATGKLVRQIVAIIENIEQHPMMGRARDEVREGLRSINVAMSVAMAVSEALRQTGLSRATEEPPR